MNISLDIKGPVILPPIDTDRLLWRLIRKPLRTLPSPRKRFFINSSKVRLSLGYAYFWIENFHISHPHPTP